MFLILLLNPSLTLYLPSSFLLVKFAGCLVLSRQTDKTSGPDDVPPRFLKEAADELVPVLCRLFHPILISCMSQYL